MRLETAANGHRLIVVPGAEVWVPESIEDPISELKAMGLGVSSPPSGVEVRAALLKIMEEHNAPLGAPDSHASDCATHNEPALPNGPCDCGVSYDDVVEPEDEESPDA